MNNKFRFIDHTGDVGVVVFGRSLKELFKHAAESFFHILTELENIQEIKSRKVSLQAYGLEELIVDWLNEFIYLFDTQSLLFRRFEIEKLNNCSLEATVWGEKYEEGRHPIKTLIKAVTFHQLQIEEENGNWKAQLIFDL
jgi:SHS2 domain-containing protein